MGCGIFNDARVKMIVYKTLRVSGNPYLYDTNTNAVLKLTEEEYTQLELIESEEDKESNSVINSLQERGICKERYATAVLHHCSSQLCSFLSNCMGGLCLQVTQNCNLRCDYCSYSGGYYNRQHTSKHMSIEIAKKSIDFLFAHSKDVEKVHVSFYGGEPLLEYNLIRSVIEYIESEYEGRQIWYSLTTNGTLLCGEILDFLVKKDFVIMLSIDGPKDIHNINRTYQSGEGSFGKIHDNLINYKRKYPNHYKKLTTNTVLPPNTDYVKVFDFFNKMRDEFSSIHLSYVAITGKKEPITYSESFSVYEQTERLKCLLNMIGKSSRSNVNPLVIDLIECRDVANVIRHPITPISKSAHPHGQCIPGTSKTFVDCEGKLYICEKISELPNLSIGDIFNGYNYSKCYEFLNIGQKTEKECLDCWAFNLCASCVCSAVEGDRLTATQRLLRCSEHREVVLDRLGDALFLLENNYNFEEGI